MKKKVEGKGKTEAEIVKENVRGKYIYEKRGKRRKKKKKVMGKINEDIGKKKKLKKGK